MLSKDSRLRLVEMCCRIKLKRKVILEERIWMSKLIESDSDSERENDNNSTNYTLIK